MQSFSGPVAQLAEQVPLKHSVEGSSPSWLTRTRVQHSELNSECILSLAAHQSGLSISHLSALAKRSAGSTKLFKSTLVILFE